MNTPLKEWPLPPDGEWHVDPEKLTSLIVSLMQASKRDDIGPFGASAMLTADIGPFDDEGRAVVHVRIGPVPAGMSVCVHWSDLAADAYLT